MSKLIPMACLALLGTAGHAWAEQTAETLPKIPQVSVSGARAATMSHTYTTLGHSL